MPHCCSYAELDKLEAKLIAGDRLMKEEESLLLDALRELRRTRIKLAALKGKEVSK
jgi:hypothetical protein